MASGACVPAFTLRSGDRLLTATTENSNELPGEEPWVTSTSRVMTVNTPVYDLKVENSENFAVKAGVILHNCPDWKYRMNFWATLNQINSGNPETRPSDETNPHDELGPACKHVLATLSNSSWILRVASVLNNYVNFFKLHRKKQYAEVIYPALYQHSYQEPVQDNIFDNQLETDPATLSAANQQAVARSRFRRPEDYQGYVPEVGSVTSSRDPRQQEIDLEE